MSSSSVLRRPHAPQPVLIITDHHYPAISISEDDHSSKKKIRRSRSPAPQQMPSTPPNRTKLQAACSPGLPIPSPLSAGPLPSPILPLFSSMSLGSASGSERSGTDSA